MNHFSKSFLLVSIICSFISCNSATSKPEYKYRKATNNKVALKAGEIEITNDELLGPIELDIFKKEMEIFEIKFSRANTLLLEKLIKADPKSKGLTNDQYFEKFISTNVKVTEEDIQKFAKKNNVPVEKINQQVKVKIEEYIKVEKKKEALDVFIAKKTKDSGIEVYINKPIPPTFEVEVGNAPFAGGKDAKVVIVEFSDFQCPYCAKAAEMVTKIKKKYGNKIKVVFKQFPLSFHSQAKKAAVASLCANEQSSESFWKMHDVFFSNQANLAPKKMKESAAKLGLKSEIFNKCLDDNKYLGQVEKDIQQGRKLNVKGTPSFFINGMVFLESNSFDKFSEFIDQELVR